MCVIPREETLELDCFAWKGTAGLAAIFRDEDVDRTEPEERKHCIKVGWVQEHTHTDEDFHFLATYNDHIH